MGIKMGFKSINSVSRLNTVPKLRCQYSKFSIIFRHKPGQLAGLTLQIQQAFLDSKEFTDGTSPYKALLVMSKTVKWILK